MKSSFGPFSMGPVLFAAVLSAASSVYAGEREGTHTGGGGDASESQMEEIRADLEKWISEGGAKGLEFHGRITYRKYEDAMLRILARQHVVIGFVTTRQEATTSDPELKVIVDGQPKTCRGFVSVKGHRPRILCNTERFGATSQSDRYRLVHHEYAGLAGVEYNVGASSDYEISNQLTDFLVFKTELRLAVLRQDPKAGLALYYLPEGTMIDVPVNLTIPAHEDRFPVSDRCFAYVKPSYQDRLVNRAFRFEILAASFYDGFYTLSHRKSDDKVLHIMCNYSYPTVSDLVRDFAAVGGKVTFPEPKRF